MERTRAASPTLLVDWLAYTAPADTPLDELLPGADRLTWVELDRGGYGYPSARAAGNVKVYYGGRPEMGVHVSITGSGCRQLEAAGILEESFIGGWPGLLKWLLGNGWKLTRLDLALDDRSGILDVAELRELVRQRAFTSRWQGGRVVESWKRRESVPGQSIEFGRRSSATFLRIYDKASEQAARGLEAADPRPWVRVELEAKASMANELARTFAKYDGSAACLAGVLRFYLDFKEPDQTDSNRRRWRPLEAWRAFLANVEAIRIGLEPKPRTLAGVLAWLEAQVAPSLAIVVKAGYGDLADLERLVYVGAQRLTARHYALLET